MSPHITILMLMVGLAVLTGDAFAVGGNAKSGTFDSSAR